MTMITTIITAENYQKITKNSDNNKSKQIRKKKYSISHFWQFCEIQCDNLPKHTYTVHYLILYHLYAERCTHFNWFSLMAQVTLENRCNDDITINKFCFVIIKNS